MLFGKTALQNCLWLAKITSSSEYDLLTKKYLQCYFPKIAQLANLSHLIIKRASGASEAFSLVMKTNCLRLRILTRNACLHLAYVSSPGVRVLNWRMRPQLAYVSSPGEYFFVSNRRACLSMSPPPLGYAKNHLPSGVQVH